MCQNVCLWRALPDVSRGSCAHRLASHVLRMSAGATACVVYYTPCSSIQNLHRFYNLVNLIKGVDKGLNSSSRGPTVQRGCDEWGLAILRRGNTLDEGLDRLPVTDS